MYFSIQVPESINSGTQIGRFWYQQYLNPSIQVPRRYALVFLRVLTKGYYTLLNGVGTII